MAVLLAGAAAWAALHVLAPPAPPAVPALVTTADLPVGHRLTETDVQARQVDPALVPAEALTGAEAVGAVLAQAVGAGEILTARRVRPALVYAGIPGTHRTVHVPVPDPGSLDLLRPGDRVDVHALADGALVGSDLLVLAVDPPGEPGTDGTGSARGVVLAVPAAAARRLLPAAAATSAGEGVHLALRPRASG